MPFLERVPLPPWLKFQVDRVWKTGDEASVSVEASAGSTADERHKLEALADAVETLESPSSSSAADLGEISGRRAEFVDQALRGANEASVKATEAALDKLSAALAAVEARERAVVATDAAAKANDVLKEKAAAAGLDEKGEVVELESWEFPGPSSPVGDEERQRLKDLEDALKVARRKSEEARLASKALSKAVDDVARVRAELESMGYQSEKERAGLQSSLGAAAERVKTASRASQAALFAAGAQIFAVVDMSKEGVVGWVRGVTDKDSSSNDFDIAAVTAPLVETAEAIELSSTIARITQWSAASAAGIQKIIAGGSISPDVGVAGSDFGDKPMTAAEVGRMIQPALQTVVAQSLVPAGPHEIRSARVACSMAAWIYYLPTTHAALYRYGLRMVVSSLDQVKSQAGKPKDANNVVARTSSFTTAQMQEMKERVTAAADAAILELERAAKLEAEDPERETAAREAAKQAAAAAKELESLSIIIEEKEREKKAARETSSMFDPEGSSSVEETPKPTPLKKMDFDPVKKGNNAADASYIDRPLPVNYCVAADDATGEIWVVIEGSTSLKSWQTNLTFQPVVFEDPTWDVRVHRGSYDAARAIYDRIEQAVVDHVNAFGADRAKVHVTGHSIGGSLAALIALMLIMRGKVPRDVINDVWTFGSPYVMCGGEALLARLGLPRSFLRSVAMGKDIVPRSFSCYYPQWARKALEFAPGSLKVDTNKQPSFLEEEMFYSPMGDMYLLQALHGSAHPLLPSGPGLYVLEGDGMYEMLVETVIVDEAGDGDVLAGRRPSRGVARRARAQGEQARARPAATRAQGARVDHAPAQRADRQLQARPQDRDRGAARGHGAGQGCVVRRRGQRRGGLRLDDERPRRRHRGRGGDDRALARDRPPARARQRPAVQRRRWRAAHHEGRPEEEDLRRAPVGHRARSREPPVENRPERRLAHATDTREVRQPAKRLGRAGGVRADGARRNEGAEGRREAQRGGVRRRALRREGGGGGAAKASVGRPRVFRVTRRRSRSSEPVCVSDA